MCEYVCERLNVRVCVCVCVCASSGKALTILWKGSCVQAARSSSSLYSSSSHSLCRGVEWLVQLHRHGHLRQVLPNVVLQNVPQADAVGVGAGGRQAGPAPPLEGTILRIPWET